MIKQTLTALAVAAVLSACAATGPEGISRLPATAQALHGRAQAAALSVVQPEMRTIAYYDRDGTLAGSPQTGGFYRVLLGRNAQGQAVVQDFYQDTQSKQVNAVIVPDEQKLTSFDVLDGQGRTVWYSPQGTLLSFADVENGKLVRLGRYDAQGRLQYAASNPDENNEHMATYYENGRVRVDFSRNADRETYTVYDENGKKLAVSDAQKGFDDVDAAVRPLVAEQLQHFFRNIATPLESYSE